MDNSGLLFIPDISGFTKFVNETEIDHSRYIIGELLENIINSNQMGLTVSEIEGDAVLFYRFGKTPSPEEIYHQVESMFCNFQKQLKNYESRRACQCSACIAAINLSLKIITHYGEFSTYNVSKHSKLIGKDVIVAHQLLKNDIDLHEYWLVTNDLFNSNQRGVDLPAGMTWQQGNKRTEKGEVTFQYSMLSLLKEKVQPDPISDFELGDNKIKVISQSKIINTYPMTVLSIIGNFFLRPKWMQSITSVGPGSHPINHVGVKYPCVFNHRTMVLVTSSFNHSNGSFSCSETDENKTTGIYYILKPLEGNKTLLVIDYYLKKDPFTQLFFPLFMKKKLSRQLAQSLNNLEELSKQPGIGYKMVLNK
jgi:hypothetical protein